METEPARSRGWVVVSTVAGWCDTCGTDVEFAAPADPAPVDLAADERGCVWCGEALMVSVERRVVERSDATAA